MKEKFIHHLYQQHLHTECINKKQIENFVENYFCFLFQTQPTKCGEQEIIHNYEKLKDDFCQIVCFIDAEKAEQITHEIFEKKIPEIFEQLTEDAHFFLESDPAAYSLREIQLTYPGFFAIAVYRLSHLLYQWEVPILPRMFSEYAHSKTGIDIHPGAKIGVPFFIDHGTGIVVGETTIIGDRVKMYQGVTLGALWVSKEKAHSKRHPTIEDEVVIYSGATILGGDTTIGRRCVIGGNAWIVKSVEPLSKVFHKGQIVIKESETEHQPINFII
ncbi:serine O-acetyltransferase EpsC [Riemerella columbina]|uniref:serine O-acetyltransferase EpsC n=1 Tax=Riemerella columbina TaxID=103810 RepID=UPI00037ADB4F|nr:serine O-acetyltransferase EpsC [Riemerella columbina]